MSTASAPEPDEGASPDGWEPGDRAYPYWDPNIESMVYAHHGDWLVSVSPMRFNDRVLLTHRNEYPRLWTAGFCYDKGPAAGLAAAVWNPLDDPYPLGFKKIAADNRTIVSGTPREDPR